ncbi:MAG: DUF4304 domain-containing protein [Sandaracinus sp.]|nr:DUF4304 domain-containing protein [Sandaracinus sp.]MCB9623045.1 DUF4304 domain-containing protein [Sandaracinus sp.]MCB9634853.1 DUF4304 domain-containing protein [Sandaracinus sp.]
MSEISKRIDAVAKLLWRDLRKVGFVGNGRTIRRPLPEGVQVVHVQGSTSNAGYEGRFYVNLGVRLRHLPSRAVEDLDPGTVLEPQCDLRHRLESLVSPSLPYWPVVGSGAMEPLAERVSDALSTYGLAWLESVVTHDGALASAQRDDPLRADLLLACGRREDAIACMASGLRAAPYAGGVWLSFARRVNLVEEYERARVGSRCG